MVALVTRHSTSLAETAMSHPFKVGDHVRWNSEAGHVGGTIVKVHTRDTEYKGHMHRCSEDDPQIKSDKTDHVALHKGAALHRID
jgi:DUF2945 family protein